MKQIIFLGLLILVVPLSSCTYKILINEEIEKYMPATTPTSEQFEAEIKTLIKKAQKKGNDWKDFNAGIAGPIGKEIRINFPKSESVIKLFCVDPTGPQLLPSSVILRIYYNNDDVDCNNKNIKLNFVDLLDSHENGYGLSQTVKANKVNSDECFEFNGKYVSFHATANKELLCEINKTYFACLRYVNEEILKE